MAELQVDQTETGLLIMGLSFIGDALLTEDGKAARARLADKLGEVAGDLLLDELRKAGEVGE
jgi:hypothetical protein